MRLENYNRLSSSAKNSIQLIKESIEKYTKFYSIVLFGTYSIGKQTKNSDLDVAILLENKKTDIQRSIEGLEIKSLIEIDAHLIKPKEFLLMLKMEEENLTKQIARKHMALHSPQIFYSLLMEGIKNGFRI